MNMKTKNFLNRATYEVVDRKSQKCDVCGVFASPVVTVSRLDNQGIPTGETRLVCWMCGGQVHALTV